MRTSATAKRLRISARKARLAADQVRGKSVGQAVNILTFSSCKGAHLVRRVIESAMANAETNDGADIDDLTVAAVTVDEGITIKRLKPRAKGRADRIFKRTCHITVTVADSAGD